MRERVRVSERVRKGRESVCTEAPGIMESTSQACQYIQQRQILGTMERKGEEGKGRQGISGSQTQTLAYTF